jgi:hypothetical protein
MPQTASELELTRQWVETWKRAGPELEEIRRREIESADTQEAIHTAAQLEPRTTSGLVEQQA